MFIVMGVQKTADIELLGKVIPIELNFADGMIGVLPVFRTRRHAEKYSKKKLTIVEIEEKKDAVQPKL